MNRNLAGIDDAGASIRVNLRKDHVPPFFCAWKGHTQLSETARPEYRAPSELSPKSASIGLIEPWNAISRRPYRLSYPLSNFPRARRRLNCSCRLNTTLGYGKVRARREALGCIPMANIDRPPML